MDRFRSRDFMQMRSLRDTRQPEVDSFKLATIGADNSAMNYNDPVKAGAGGEQ